MEFRYYIADLMKGTIEGTNDTLLADSLCYREGYMIVDVVRGERLLAGGERLEVAKIEKTINRRIHYDQFRRSMRAAHSKLHERKLLHQGEEDRHALKRAEQIHYNAGSECA